MTSLSICIIAYREKELLERAIRSAVFADEVLVVVDSEGDAETEAVARKLGVKVVIHKYEGDIEQKSFAVSQACHEWVLSLDADEEVGVDLRGEIQNALENQSDELSGFYIERVTWHLGKWIRHGDFYPDHPIRLFRRSRTVMKGSNPHGRFSVDGEVGRLREPILHYSYRDLSDQVGRVQRFSDMARDSMIQKERNVYVSDLLVRPLLRFIRAYFLKQGFRDGFPGLIIAVVSSFHVFLKYAKLWESKLSQEKRAPRL